MLPFFPYVHVPNYQFGPFAIQMFGLSIAMAVIVGASFARRRAEQMKLDFDLFIDSFFWVIPGGFLISHFVSVILYFPERIAKNPLTLLYVWEGISSFGGFLGGIVVAYLFFRWKKVPVLPYMEAQAYGLIPGFLIGRVGCAITHDHPGMWLPATIEKGTEIAVTTARVGGKYVTKVIHMPGWESNSLWIALIVFVITAGLLASLVAEKPIISRTPLATMALSGILFVLMVPMLPSLVRTFGIPFPHQISSNWMPGVTSTYFNLQNLEPSLSKRVLQELPLVMSSHFDTSTLQPFFFDKVPYEVTVPPRLVWGDFSYTTTLFGTSVQKTYMIKTRLAYDLGLFELVYYVMFFTILHTLLQGQPRREGFILSMWFISYAPVRFMFDLLRTADKRYDGLTPGNYMAILTFLLGVFIYLNRSEQKAGEYVAPGYEDAIEKKD